MASNRLNQLTIDSVKERADIVDVVGEHVVLKKRGREYVGICPFHDDSKPSMTVSPTKQFYYCFSCGAGGNSIKFLMEYQRLSFSEVVIDLAKKYQIPIQTIEGPQHERLKKQISLREKLYKVMSLASGWFQGQLVEPSGQVALEYLKKQRNLKDGTLLSFQIGYAPDQWDGLLNYLLKVENLDIELIERAGLIVPRKSGSGHYDRFRNRIILPILDRQQRVIGFGARSLDGTEPKYLNSPETEIFEKGKNIFGLEKASNAIHSKDCAIVVEGYFDVIALHQAGITNSVASLGTALSSSQITQLCRCTDSKRIILNFDADSAGVRAANRAISEVENLALHGQLELKVLHLPNGKDPDEFLKLHSAIDYGSLIDNSPLWLDWQLEQCLFGLDLTKSDQFQIGVKQLVELLGKLPQSALRTHYIQKSAERLSGGHARFAIQLEEDLRKQVKGHRWHGRSQRYEKPEEATLRERCESDILFFYINCPDLRVFIREELQKRDLDDFAIYFHRIIWLAICNLEESFINSLSINNANSFSKQANSIAEVNLGTILLDYILINNSDIVHKLTPLIQPGELQQLSLTNPISEIKGALAVLERQKSLKRCRHLIDAWSSQRLETLENCIASLINEDQNENSSHSENMEIKVIEMFNELNSDALNFQNLYYNERKHILHLDKERCYFISNEKTKPSD